MKALLIILILTPFYSLSQGFMAMDTLENTPNFIVNTVTEKISLVRTIDLNGNGKRDFIVTTETIDEQQYRYLEYWILDNSRILKKKERFKGGRQFSWFVNLDNDPELELFSASGYEDGIDYAFYDLNLSDGSEELLFFFNPIIIEGNNLHWGYPWDIHDIYVRTMKNGRQLLGSIDHKIVRDGVVTLPEDQPLLPIIFFGDHSTQPHDRSAQIGSRNWFSIEQLSNEAHNNR